MNTPVQSAAPRQTGMQTGVKYRGDKPRGFAVLTARPKTGRAVAGEFNSPRPSRDGSAGIYTRTLGASVRVGGSTPPDNTRRTTSKARILRGVAFPRNCAQLLRVKVFNPRRNRMRTSADRRKRLTAFTLGVKPRGTRPAPPVEVGSCCRKEPLKPSSRQRMFAENGVRSGRFWNQSSPVTTRS